MAWHGVSIDSAAFNAFCEGIPMPLSLLLAAINFSTLASAVISIELMWGDNTASVGDLIKFNIRGSVQPWQRSLTNDGDCKGLHVHVANLVIRIFSLHTNYVQLQINNSKASEHQICQYYEYNYNNIMKLYQEREQNKKTSIEHWMSANQGRQWLDKYALIKHTTSTHQSEYKFCQIYL